MLSLIISVFFNCLAFLLLLLAVTAIYIFVNDHFSPLRKIPAAPLTDPFFGIIGTAIRHNGRVIELFSESLEKYGMVKRCHLFLGEIRILVSDPAWITHVLVTNAKNYSRENYAGVEFVRKVVGESSLILISGEDHKRLRRFASPAFKPSLLKSFVSVYVLCANRLVNTWKAMCRVESTVNIRSGLINTTIDVIGLSAFGYDFHSFDSDETQYSKAMKIIMENSGLNLTAVLPFYSLLYDLCLGFARYAPECMFRTYKNTVCVHKLVEEVIRCREMQRIDSLDENGVSKTRQNLLDYVLAGSEKGTLSMDELRDMVMTFVLAGHETSSVAMSWVLLQLAKYPEVQEKCHVEAKNVFEDIKGTENLSWDSLKRFSYLESVIHETMRLYPPVPYVNRCTLVDDTIAGYPIPKGTDILLTICELHRNPNFWGEDAGSFRPERFLEIGSEPEGPWNKAFFPFGAGIHKCIGYQFALTEITAVLAIVVMNFRFEMVPGDVFHERADITMKPNPNLRLNVFVRE